MSGRMTRLPVRPGYSNLPVELSESLYLSYLSDLSDGPRRRRWADVLQWYGAGARLARPAPGTRRGNDVVVVLDAALCEIAARYARTLGRTLVVISADSAP